MSTQIRTGPKTRAKPKAKRALNKYPRGWNRQKIDELARYYDKQSDEEAVAEAEGAFADPDQTVMLVPVELVPQVQKLLARHAKSR